MDYQRALTLQSVLMDLLQSHSPPVTALGVGKIGGGAITEGGPNDFCVHIFVAHSHDNPKLIAECMQLSACAGMTFGSNDLEFIETGRPVQLQEV